MADSQTKHSAFLTLISVFFFWGFVAASNDILIPVFKEKLNLLQWQSQLIAVAFYVGYTVGSALYLLLCGLFKRDLLSAMGYKNGIALGLCVSALGTLLFYPAAELVSFTVMICGLFIVALGFSLQQTAANPLAIAMGPIESASQRLSLAGGINNIGTTVGPVVVSYAIFGSMTLGAKLDSIDAVKYPYLILGFAFLIVAVFFKFSSLPEKIEDPKGTAGSANSRDLPTKTLQNPQVLLGMIAIFVYVGVEVSTAANLPEYMKQHLGVASSNASPYVSLFWASLMIGRWASAAGVFNVGPKVRFLLQIVMPFLAFGIFLLVNAIAGNELTAFYRYGFVILILIAADLSSRGKSARQLVIYSLCAIAALLLGMLTQGLVSVYAFISVGLFCSTLWPCIFALAINGLGKNTAQASSYLIMMIMGGGLISWLQGWLASDDLLGIKGSYMVGIVCFLYLLFYGLISSHLVKQRHLPQESST